MHVVHVVQRELPPVDLVALGLDVCRIASNLGKRVEIEVAPKRRRFLSQPASIGDVMQTVEYVCLSELCRNLRGGPSKQRQRTSPPAHYGDAVVGMPCLLTEATSKRRKTNLLKRSEAGTARINRQGQRVGSRRTPEMNAELMNTASRGAARLQRNSAARQRPGFGIDRESLKGLSGVGGPTSQARARREKESSRIVMSREAEDGQEFGVW